MIDNARNPNPKTKKNTQTPIVFFAQDFMMTDSLAARLEKPSFMEAFNRSSAEFTAEQIATLVNEPCFMEAFNHLSEEFIGRSSL